VKRLTRPGLDATSKAALAKLTKRVAKAKDPVAEARRLWDQKAASTFTTIRTNLEAMASGRGRCMYCEDSLGTDIEHFYPKRKYPKRAFDWTNYLLACSHCNSNQKRDQFPLKKRRPMLIDPSADDPSQHLAFLPSSGELKGIDEKGATTIDVFRLNEAAPPRKLPQARLAVLLKLQALLKVYDEQMKKRNRDQAELAKRFILDEPFAAVLGWLIQIAQSNAAAQLLSPGIPELLGRHSVASW
jgi:uncharacterized protein (TIGR02646 family)